MHEDFALLKRQTEIEYKKIGTVYCPALKSEVVFNSDGFHHLRYDSARAERSKSVQRNKLMLLPKAKWIIEKTTTIQEYRRNICTIGKPDKGGFHQTKTFEWFGFFAVVSVIKRIRVKAVVRRIGGESGFYHFWSVIPYWTISNNIRIVGSREIEDE